MKRHLLTLLAASLVVCLAGAGSSFAQTRDLAQEEVNRTLVLKFYDQVFVKH